MGLFTMKVRIQWVGSKKKFFKDLSKIIIDEGSWLEINNVTNVEIEE